MASNDLEEVKFVKSLHKRLSEIADIKLLDLKTAQNEDPESWKIALNLVHIVNSSDKIKIMLQKIPDSSSDKCDDLLSEIRAELRHIQWHILNMEYFGQID